MLRYKELSEVDLKLALYSGSTIKVGNLEIEPYTLDEIREYGYSKYMRNLQWISISVDDFISSVMDLEKRVILEQQRTNLKTFDFFIKLGGREILYDLLVALAMILKTDDIRILDENAIAIDFEKDGIYVYDEDGNLTIDEQRLEEMGEDELKLVHRDNFDEIIEVVKLQNYLMKPVEKSEPDENPADEATRLLFEQMKKYREKVEKAKKRSQENDDEDVDISDIISSVSSKSYSINELNVWQLTLYQLYHKYARLELIDNYNFSIKAMMAGAEKVDLKHWSSKL